MNKLSTDEIVLILRNLDAIEGFTFLMRREVKAPTAGELYPACAAVDIIRGLILGASVHPVEMESVPDNAPATESLAPLEPRAPRRPRKPAGTVAPVADATQPGPSTPPPADDELPFDRWDEEQSRPASGTSQPVTEGGLDQTIEQTVLGPTSGEIPGNKLLPAQGHGSAELDADAPKLTAMGADPGPTWDELTAPLIDPYQQIADRILEKVRGAKTLSESAALASDVDVIAGLKTLNAEAPTLAAQVKQEAIAKRDELAKGVFSA